METRSPSRRAAHPGESPGQAGASNSGESGCRDQSTNRLDIYTDKAISKILSELAASGGGSRANTTYRCSAALGGFVGARILPHDQAEELLLAALPISHGFGEREARGHIRRGLRAGALTPRELPDFGGECRTTARVAVRPPKPVRADPLKLPPPTEEVQRLWGTSIPVIEDAEAVHWLAGRSIKPEAVALWDLARVIAPGTHLPGWAALGSRSWLETGNRLLIPLWDGAGEMVNFKARYIRAGESRFKSLSPQGHASSDAIMACPLGQQVLRSCAFPSWVVDPQVLILEGGPDFLTWATQQRECSAEGPVVFGMFSGGWTATIADRIPSDVDVSIRTDANEAGRRYAREIIATIGSRCRTFIRREVP